jgi:hypothetical protein
MIAVEFKNLLVLDLNDEQKYFVRLHSGDKVFTPQSEGLESKFDCLYWIYMNGNCFLSTNKYTKVE